MTRLINFSDDMILSLLLEIGKLHGFEDNCIDIRGMFHTLNYYCVKLNKKYSHVK
jgi:hypothetical protein